MAWRPRLRTNRINGQSARGHIINAYQMPRPPPPCWRPPEWHFIKAEIKKTSRYFPGGVILEVKQTWRGSVFENQSVTLRNSVAFWGGTPTALMVNKTFRMIYCGSNPCEWTLRLCEELCTYSVLRVPILSAYPALTLSIIHVITVVHLDLYKQTINSPVFILLIICFMA